MEPQGGTLMDESVAKNMIDKDEYLTAAIENRCIAILADLWNVPDPSVVTGCSTTGSRGLREHGWQVPAYTFPDNRAVLRVVCRNGFSRDLAELFLRDLKSVTAELVHDAQTRSGPAGFHHGRPRLSRSARAC